MRKLYCIFFLLVICSCSKETDFAIENLNGNSIDKLGHAGMGIGDTYPMNSMESILHCLSYDMDGSEMDIQMTRDSVLVLYHDDFLQEKTNAFGLVHDNYWNQLEDAHYTITPHTKYKLVKLEDLLNQLKDKNVKFAFDVKYHTNYFSEKYVHTFKNQLVKMIADFDLLGRVNVESQDTLILDLLEKENPEIHTYIYHQEFDEAFKIAQKYHLDGLTLSILELNQSLVKKAHDNNLKIAAWNTHSKKLNRAAIQMNVDIIETDKVAYLSKLIP